MPSTPSSGGRKRRATPKDATPKGASTSSFALPYPVLTDPADVPADIKKLADRLEVVLAQLQAATPAQPLPGDLKWVGYPVAAGSEGAQCPGWLLCDGRQVAKATYPELWAKIGTAHGPADAGGTGNFSLPDSRGRSPMGAGSGPGLTARALGAKLGEEGTAITVGQMPSHQHTGKTSAGKTAAGATGAGTLAAHKTTAGQTGTGSTGTGTSGQDSPDHAHSGSTDSRTPAGSANVVASRQGSSAGNVVTILGPSGSYNTGISLDAHSHGVSVGGASARHAHSVPSLSIPALAIPQLDVAAQPIPALSIPQLDVPQLDITAEGGGAAHNTVHPSFVGNCLIKT